MTDYRPVLALALIFPAASSGQVAERPPAYQFYDRRMLSAPPPEAAVERFSLPAPPASAEPEAAARAFLEDHRDRLGIESTAFFSLPLERRYESPAARLTHLVFRRRHAGVPVFGGDVVVHVASDGRVLDVQPGAPWPSGAQPRLAASLSSAEAATAALGRLAAETAPVPRSPAAASLVWFPLGSEVRLGWELYLHLDAAHYYCAVVDAETGELLFSHNLYRDQRPQGSVFRAPDEPHPGLGTPSVEPFTGWPASQGDCPAAIYPAPYRSGVLLHRCWVAGSETAGNNVSACLDADGDNRCDWRASDLQSRFLFPFTNAYAADGDPAPDRPAAVTNLFYWNNVLHDWLYGLGFDERSGNFQEDNFGRGGSGSDAVQADAQDGALRNTANFATPPDGLAPRMQVALFNSSGSFLRRDAAFDGDLLVHEYVHGLTLRLVGGPFNTNSLPLWQSGALGEGWSDAYAASFTNDPVIGEYVSTTPATGIRSVAYDNSPYTFGRFGTLYRRNVGPLGLILDLPQIHRDGEIWATVLWDLRRAMGKSGFEQVVTNALKLTPARPSMLDARDAVLQAAQAMGLAVCPLWTVFARRGFGASAALNHIQPGQARDTALSVYEAFDLPLACGGSPPQFGAAVFSDDVEAGAGAWTATGLWHVTARRAAGGLRSWWFGQETTGNYATGSRTAGTLTSAPIDLTGVSRAVLEWDQLFFGEGFGRNYPLDVAGNDPYLNYDSGWVLASRDGGATWETLTTLAHNSSPGVWDHHRIDLSRLAGSVIRLRFLFDTLDAGSNTAEGWYIDNIQIRRVLTGVPALRVSPASLQFAASVPQTITVSNDDLGLLSWTAASSAPWLAVTPAAGSGNATLTVSVAPAGLPAGTYAGTVTITAPGAAGSPAVVAVTLTVAGPEARWSFDEPGAGPGIPLTDAAGHGHIISTHGYGTVAAPGVAGSARLLNGVSDWLEAAPSAALSPPSFTFSIWVKLLSYPAAAGWGVVAADYGGNYQGWYLGVHASGRVILCIAGLPSSAPWLLSSASLALGRWYRLTAAYDGATREGAIYLNGSLEVQAAFPAFTPQTALPLTFGRAPWFPGYYLNAALDEAVLHPVRQTAAEILADYRSFPAAPAPDGNLAVSGEWPLDDAGSTLADVSGNGRAGLASGGAVVPGVRNSARLFNGVTDRARVPASEAFGPASFSVRAWVKLVSYPAGWGVIISDYGGDYQGWYLGVHSTGRVILSIASLPSSSPWLLSYTALSLNRWHYVAATYDGPTRLATLYVDGAPDTQAAFPGFTPNPTAGLYLGRATWYDGYYLSAALDEIRVVPSALAPAAILLDYQSFPSPPLPAPVGEWRLDDAGPILADSSGNARPATAYGTAGVSGRRNAARRFNGISDRAEVPASAALTPPSFTWRAWVRPNALPSPWGVVAANYGGNYQGWFVGIHASGRVILALASLPSSAPWLVSNAPLTPGAWHHIAVTYDAAARAGSIYVNGVRDAAAIFPGLTPQASVPLTLGRASWYDGYYLAADLDEIRLLDYPQPPAEIYADFQSFP